MPEGKRLSRPGTFRAGDVALLSLGIILLVPLGLRCWHTGEGERVVVRSGGRVVAEIPLLRDALLQVPGPLGVSAIRIHGGRARVESDPGPRQYCVRQGWLQHAGEVAACLPNQVTLEVAGRTALYDTLNY